jgi:hypothetical protein
MHTKGPYAVPYTCGGIPQHSTYSIKAQESRCLVRWASLAQFCLANVCCILRPIAVVSLNGRAVASAATNYGGHGKMI